MTTSPFLPPNESATFERVDQGVDFKTRPGGPIVAPWAGVVKIANPNPGGFGTHYPLITFTAGPYKGQTWYVGHTLALVTGAVKAGQPISRTGHGTESWVGNATGIPGHAEIGRWPPGSMSAGAAVKSIVLGGQPTMGSGGQLFGLVADVTGSLTPAGLVKALLKPAVDEGFRMLLYTVLVLGGLGLAVMGALRLAGAHPPKKEAQLAAA